MPPSTFFTTPDGDVILRADQGSGQEQDFRVHRLVLSLSSPAFKDMFELASPDANVGQPVPVVQLADPPETIDTILKFIYPGVESPEIKDLSTLATVLDVARKYDIDSIVPALRKSLKGFLPNQCVKVYLLGCRFGFEDEAKKAARLTTPLMLGSDDYSEEVKAVSSNDLYRLIRFTAERELQGVSEIKWSLENALKGIECDHADRADGFYRELTAKVTGLFASDPSFEYGELLSLFDTIPDPPFGCAPSPHPAANFFFDHDESAFSCPLMQMSIRNTLVNLVHKLEEVNDSLVKKYFG